MDNKERQYWFDILPSMTDEKIERLFNILNEEKNDLVKLDRERQEEIIKINEKSYLELSQKALGTETIKISEAKELIDSVVERIKKGKIDKGGALIIFKAIADKLAKTAASEADVYTQFDKAISYARSSTDNPQIKLDLYLKQLPIAQNAFSAGIISASQVSGKILNISWWMLHLGKYAEAERYCLEGLKLSPKALDLETNLAHALALQNKKDEAIALYKKNIGKEVIRSDGRKLWEVIMIDDFTQLAKAGVTSSIFDEVRPFLEKSIK